MRCGAVGDPSNTPQICPPAAIHTDDGADDDHYYKVCEVAEGGEEVIDLPEKD